MKADPDFHPIAAAWIEGTATPPEQRLLDELLATDPAAVEDYSAICRTEALLHQAGRSAAERRKSLAAMLSGKPWPHRVAGFLKSRTVRWAAAAAALAIAAWVFWPSAAPEENQTAKENRVPARMEDAPLTGDTAIRSPREASLLPIADGLEQKLRRHYVPNFKVSAPLSEAAAALAKAIPLHPALSADVRHDGDAPVHLQLSMSLPAWTLLELMALQSGTDFQISGRNLVFRVAPKPVPMDNTLTRTSELTPVRSLLCVKEDKLSDELMFFGAAARQSLGSRIEFSSASETSVSYSGPPRDVRVLEKALRVTAEPPQRVRLTMTQVEVPAGIQLDLGAAVGQRTSPGLYGVFTAEQFKVIFEDPRKIKGVKTFQPAPQQPRPGEVAEFQFNLGQAGMVAIIEAIPGEEGTSCDLGCTIGSGFGLPSEGVPLSDKLFMGQYLLVSGQTLGFGGFPEKNGTEVFLFLTASVISVSEAVPATSDPVPAQPPEVGEPAEGLLYGTPVVGEKGKVYSPYAPDKGLIDVEGFKRGARVECPYTGKHFRVP